MDRRTVARWESRGGAHAVTLYANTHGYGYQGRNCGGSLGRLDSDSCAIERMQGRVYAGEFQPDANKTTMRRTQ